jgi:hypothetical protein
MSEPREWFLYESVSEDHDTLTAVPRGDDPYDQYANMTTVIEKSVYDRLKQHTDALVEALANMSENFRDGISQEAWEAVVAYRKDFPR